MLAYISVCSVNYLVRTGQVNCRAIYFGELEAIQQKLMESIQCFGKRYVKIQHEDFRQKDKEHQQKIAGEFVTMNADVNNKIEAFKSRVLEIVKS